MDETELRTDDSAPPATQRQVYSWALWDWATQPFNSVILTFVWVPLFLISTHLLPDEIAALPEGDPALDRALAELSANYGLVTFLASIAILLLAPVLGQRADTAGRKKRGLLIATSALALIQFALFFVQADPAYFWFGAVVMAIGAVVSEIAGVNYNAMLVQVSDRHTVGKVSGLGWGMGYIGGILALVIVVVLTQLEWFGMDTSNGMAYRVIAVGCAVWTVVFSIPIFRNVPESAPREDRATVGFLASYRVLFGDIA
ncbi:MAG: MFS transporter, partial [Propionibacteriaceae bacterium]|nr:MFS transporter [Propionibacteriaceae bacterium]